MAEQKTTLYMLKGLEENLPTEKVSGRIYYCTDTSNMFIDELDTTTNKIVRKQLNANKAKYLKSDDLKLYIDNKEISLGRTNGESNYELDGGDAGLYSIAVGSNTSAIGDNSQAFGAGTSAVGKNSFASGRASVAQGPESHAEGASTLASGEGSHAEGVNDGLSRVVSNDGSMLGVLDKDYTIRGTTAMGYGSHAEGSLSFAYGAISHAEGMSDALGEGSHSEGVLSQAEGAISHAEGIHTIAAGMGSHAEGGYMDEDGKILDEFQHPILTDLSIISTVALGVHAHAEGAQTIAAQFATHSEGYGSVAYGGVSHAEGVGTVAEGEGSHAEGGYTLAEGMGSHAEGAATQALGSYSHAGGYSSTAAGDVSFVHGAGLWVDNDCATAFGKYNFDDGSGNIAFSIGNGTDASDCSNAMSVNWDGSAKFQGTVNIADPIDNYDAATKHYVDEMIPLLKMHTHKVEADNTERIKFDGVLNMYGYLVYYNGLLLTYGENYLVEAPDTVIFNGWTADTGDMVVIVGKQFVDINEGNIYSASRLITSDVGTKNRPVYFKDGVPVICEDTLDVDVSGNANSASLARFAEKIQTNIAIGSNKHPVYLTKDGVITACDLTLENNITGNAATATRASNADSADNATNAKNAETAAKLTTTTAGSNEKPVYFASGVPVACGNTLNVSIKGSSTSCSGNAATATTATTATKLSAGAGSATKPAYINSSGQAAECGNTLAVDISGKAATAGQADNATTADSANVANALSTTTKGSATKPVYFAGGIPVECGNSLGVNITGSSASCTGNAATATTASSCSGNAATATKLQTSKIISLAGDVTGSGTFDGSDNLSITTKIANFDSSQFVKITGDQSVAGVKTFSNTIIQGSPSTDATLNGMNKFSADLFVAGDGHATNTPSVPGFYLGKSQTDDNRHMDIVSGGDYSYIDFNKASRGVDYDARLLVNVTNGKTEWAWGASADLTQKIFEVKGQVTATQFNGALNGNATSATTASTATNATNIYSSASTAKAYVLGTTTASSANHATVYNASVYTSGSVLYGATWNDYAEFRETKEEIEPGRVVCENGDDTLSLSVERMQPGAEIVSDTFGFAIGETEQCKTPIAVSGRVLAYPYEDRNSYQPGDAVCAGPNGTVSKMTREEIREYPERIVGTVSAIPEYETWGATEVPVKGRIWIKVK